jgi:hypothetical protein
MDQLCGWCASTSKCILAKAAGFNAGFVPCNSTEPCESGAANCCKTPCEQNAAECDGTCASFIGNYKIRNPTYYTADGKAGNPNPQCPGYYTSFIKCDGEPKCCTADSEASCFKNDYGGAIKCGWCPETSTCDVLKYYGFEYSSINGAPTCKLASVAAPALTVSAVAAVGASLAIAFL